MRKNLKLILLTVIMGGFISSVSGVTTDNQKEIQHVKIGDLEGIILSDGYVNISPIQPAMAPDIATSEVNNFLATIDSDTTSVDLPMNILLLKKNNRLILFDTGTGDMGDTGGLLKKNLGIVGITSEQITDIIITHAHYDHIAGLLDSEGKSIYPNATIYMTKIEYDFWMSENPDFSRSKSTDVEMRATTFGFIQNTILKLKPQIKLIEDKDILFDCIQVEIAPGHTPGHIITTIFSNDEKIVAIADIVHASNMLFANPRWGTSFDWDFDLGVKTRLSVLKRLNMENALIFGYHLPYPGVGYIGELAPDSYKWMPICLKESQQ